VEKKEKQEEHGRSILWRREWLAMLNLEFSNGIHHCQVPPIFGMISIFCQFAQDEKRY
jgi:hypothetical protein